MNLEIFDQEFEEVMKMVGGGMDLLQHIDTQVDKLARALGGADAGEDAAEGEAGGEGEKEDERDGGGGVTATEQGFVTGGIRGGGEGEGVSGGDFEDIVI
jgi:hypothetical protein